MQQSLFYVDVTVIFNIVRLPYKNLTSTLLNTAGIGLSSMYLYENDDIWYNSDTTEIFQRGESLIEPIVHVINNNDTKLQLWLEQEGSAEERTKTGIPDEINMRLHIVGLEDGATKVVKKVGSNLQLSVNAEARHIWVDFMDNNNILLSDKLFKYVESLCCEALANTDLFIYTKFYFFIKRNRQYS